MKGAISGGIRDRLRELDHLASAERVPTGVARLDEMPGGKGVFRGSSVLVSGSPGRGKSRITLGNRSQTIGAARRRARHTARVRSKDFQMIRDTPTMRDCAERLIAYETRANKSSGTKTPVACLVSEKLRPQLATLMGDVGFRSLLSRALALANAEVAWLRAVNVKSDGSLEGLDQLETQVDPNEIFEGCVVLLAQLLGLLMAFIGANLTLHLVREVWPKLPLDDLDFGKGDKNEKSK